MVLSLGYENTESESKFFILYKNKNYSNLISKIFKQKLQKKLLEVELNTIKTAYSTKYSIIFRNLLFFKFNKDMWNINFEFSSKKQMFKLVNFEISPITKIMLNNENIPLTFAFKVGKYQATRDQIFELCDYSKLLKSMLPYLRTGLSISHNNTTETKIFGQEFLWLYKTKIGANRIHDYEDNVKLSSSLKTLTLFDKVLPFKTSLSLTNQISFKNSFVYPKKGNNVNNIHEYRDNHVLSSYSLNSRLVGLNILSEDYLLDNGVKFYIQNTSTLRLTNIPYLRDSDILSRIEPYCALETFFVPNQQTKFKYVFSTGISLKVADYMFIDFSLFSTEKNTKLDKNLINRFRIHLELATSF